MSEQRREIEFEVEEGQPIRIVGSGPGEPAKNDIVRRALEIAAQDGRSNLANQSDYERAALEYSSDAKLMERGDMDANEAPEARDPNEAYDKNRDS